MILRKPYRILIKYFKLIHLVLGIMSAYLLSKTLNLMNFFNEYQERTQTIISSGTSKQYFSGLLVILSLLVFVGSITIFIIMRLKKKPILFYTVTIIAYLIMVAIYIYDKSIISTLELHVISMQTVKFAGDLTTMCFIVQLLSTILFFTRAIGFNLNKFDFDNDLKLEIDETDNEEFEFDLDYDSNNTKRSLNRMIRNFRYSYQENKMLYIFGTIITVILIALLIYLYFFVFNKIYKENEIIKSDDYSFKINNLNLINTNYKNKKITDEYLVIAEMDLKDLSGKSKSLETANLYLKINDVNYYPTKKYNNEIKDLGNVYKKQILTNDYNKYLFVFEIPKSQIKKKMILYYTGAKKIKISPKKITKGQEKKVGLNQELKINSKTIKINSFEIKDKIKSDYKFCETTNKCYTSYEYIVPTLTDNYEKVIIKINGTGDFDNKLIETYGSITYTLNGEEKQMDATIKRVYPIKSNVTNVYYYEVYKEIKNATNISLDFVIRKNTYKYVLK